MAALCTVQHDIAHLPIIWMHSEKHLCVRQAYVGPMRTTLIIMLYSAVQPIFFTLPLAIEERYTTKTIRRTLKLTLILILILIITLVTTLTTHYAALKHRLFQNVLASVGTKRRYNSRHKVIHFFSLEATCRRAFCSVN